MPYQDRGNHTPICRYCDGAVTVPRYFDGRDMPEAIPTQDFHASAKCVEGVEPSVRMGGPR